MPGEFKGGGHLRDQYGREVFSVAPLNDPLDASDVQAGGEVLTTDGKKQIVLLDSTGDPITNTVSAKWTPTDAVHRRVKAELRDWLYWLDTYAPGGFLGEFGVPDNRYAVGDDVKWNALLEGYYRDLQRSLVWSSQWGASQAFATYELAPYTNPLGIGNALNTVKSQAVPLENHADDVGVRRGVALTGLEFGTNTGFSNTNPGTFGVDYYLEPAASYTFVVNRGVRMVRVGFRWERLQPTLGGSLDFSYSLRLANQVLNAQSAGLQIVLDCHNYGEYYVAPGVGTPSARLTIGDGTLTQDHFVDLWSRVSAQFSQFLGVVAYGLMNEPHDMATGADGWELASQAAVDAIRANGDNKLIMVGGYNFSKVQGWATTHPQPWISDHNFMYEAHHYFDSESSSGGAATSVYSQTYASALADAVAAGY
jgi:hypothetical protein